MPGDQDWNEPSSDPAATTSCSTGWASYSRAGRRRRRRRAAAAVRRRRRPARPASPASSTAPTRRRTRPTRRPRHCEHDHVVRARSGDPPDFASAPAASWEGAGPFSPRTGDCLHALAVADEAWKRLTRDDRPHRQVHRRPEFRVELEHRGGLGLRVRRGPRRRPGQLDDAAGPQRPHDTDTGESCPAAPTTSPCTRSSPTTSRARAPAGGGPVRLHAGRHQRHVEPVNGQLGWLRAVEGRPQPASPASRSRSRSR